MAQEGIYKKEVIKALRKWAYSKEKATPFTISKKVGCSEGRVVQILRDLKYEKIAKKSTNGSWYLL